MIETLLLASSRVHLHLDPSLSLLPGGRTLERLVNGLAGWALVGALVALVLGAAAWALGAHAHNVHQAASGRRAVLASGAAALLIGAAPVLINFFFRTGASLS
jgi:hypothetical protein